jgi:arginine deiminase
VRAHAGEHLLDVLSEVLQAPTFNAIPTGGDAHDDTADAWDDGTGVFALEPGVVIGFDRNARTNRRLRQAGVEVVEIPGGELGRTGAGPHALGCAIARDAVSYPLM